MSCLSGLPGSQANYLHVDLVRKWWITKNGHAKEQLHCTVAQSRQAKLDMKRITALQKCCKVLGRNSGLEKRKTALHELPGPGKPKPDMQKDNCIAVLQGNEKKKRTRKEQLHCTALLPGPSKKSVMQRKNCTALLPGPGKINRTCKRTALHCCLVPASKTGNAKE